MGSDSPPEHFEEPRGSFVSLHVSDPTDAERIFHAFAEGSADADRGNLLGCSFRRGCRSIRFAVDNELRESYLTLSIVLLLHTSFYISIKGDEYMEYRIVEKPSFKVVGKTLRVATKDGENMRRIPQFWDECHHDGSHDRLVALATKSANLGEVTLGICMDFAGNMEEFTYMIAAEGSEGDAGDGMVEKTIPAATWAVFETKGPMPDAIQAVWGHIWSEFFPSAPFKHADGPDLELYPRGDPTQPDYRSEVWVPVVSNDANGTLPN